jgi:hypothetical protein
MDEKDHLNTLSDIKSLMERSSRFLSLSGFSGIFIGIYALAGAIAAWWYIPEYSNIISSGHNVLTYYQLATHSDSATYSPFLYFLIADAVAVLLLSLITAYVLTQRFAKKQGAMKWDAPAKRMLVNYLIPLVTGGVFCLILLQHEQFGLITPSMLVFYGLSLINASKYTYNDLRNLGVIEIILGLLASVNTGYGLLFWAIGFGVMHIIYGITMYYKYER